ncbi:hypothetical protein [Ensifer adhaerens]|uniref:hypothetical protein n=1 Tax=Ensifer adhaerens TaxID=106592 RepID=UPI002030477C|nr:hypothetical protein [Ensifer adhaerens]
MSRGHGRIERAIIELFGTGDTWTVEDLCNAAYPGLNRIERKHRVAARRAAHNVAEECGVEAYGCGIAKSLVIFVRINAPSHVIRQTLQVASNRLDENWRGRGPRRKVSPIIINA